MSSQQPSRLSAKPSNLGRKHIDDHLLKTAEPVLKKLDEVGASTYAKAVSSDTSVKHVAFGSLPTGYTMLLPDPVLRGVGGRSGRGRGTRGRIPPPVTGTCDSTYPSCLFVWSFRKQSAVSML